MDKKSIGDGEVPKPEVNSILTPDTALRKALSAWELGEPRMLRSTEAGINNLSRFVDTPGGTFFLRVYLNTNELGHIRYEHALLIALADADLSFAVPRPLLTCSGESFTRVQDSKGDMIASLFPLIPGQHPRRGDVSATVLCGEALAELDDALARVVVDPRLPRYGTYGDLAGGYSPTTIEQLPIPRERKLQLIASFEELLGEVPRLYADLSRQTIHSDMYPANSLIHDGRVTGILDFEFASPDLRAMDFAVGIKAFGLSVSETTDKWACIEAFARGYSRRISLTYAEVVALPVLLRLGMAASLVHWLGRLERGYTTEADIVERSGDLLALDEWLDAHGERLVERVATSTH